MQHSDIHMTNRNSSGQTAPCLRPQKIRYLSILLIFTLLLLPLELMAADENALQSISHKRLAGNKLQVTLEFAHPPQQPLSFTIADPARIALDFANTRNNLAKRTHKVGIGAARSVSTAQAKDRTRVVLNLSNMVNYQTDIQDKRVIITLASGSSTKAAAAAEPEPVRSTQPVARRVAASTSSISNIDFRRGRDGAGRIMLTLTDPNTPITIKQQGSRVIIDLLKANIPANLQRRLNVTDFATPVDSIEAKSKGAGSQIIIKNHGEFSQLAYQSDNLYTVEVKPASKQQIAKKKKTKEKAFTGERLSLNFQDIEVRSVLQLIADFTGLNVVVSDSVTGNVTLRLKNVPWDQALDIILNTKGLDKRQKGNVLYIAPAEEIAAREKAVLEAEKEVQELAPLRTEIFALNYADAADMASLLQSQQGSGAGSNSNSLLSSRGSVTIDSRTNNLLVQDTDEKLEEIRELINTLDVAVRQVLIEARIVNASDNFTRDLGVSFSASDRHLHNGDLSVTTDFAINLPAANPAGTLGLALAKIPLGTALDLELSAAQNESTAEIVASPRIMTANKNTARIEQGVEIPYQEASSSGATSTSFKKAVLSLEVTPHITRDDRINMELNVKRDSVGQVFSGVPSIDTREVETRVNVENGQTVVLGGIFEETITNGSKRVPFLSDIPVLGYLFRSDTKRNDRSELLIFVTPKIVNDDLTLR